MQKAKYIFLLCLILTGCVSPQKQYRIGVSQCLDDAWRQKMNNEMQCELLLHPEMKLYTRFANGSNELQCAQIDSFIQERVDLLIVSPNEAEEVKPAVTRAYHAGIPVIVADRRVTGDEWTAFIGGDNYQVGVLMADWIHSIQSTTSHRLHVLEVCGLPGSTPATLRHKGMIESLAGHDTIPLIRSVQGLWQKEDAYRAVCSYLSQYANVELIVAQNDLMAIGAAEAVRDTKGYGSGSVRIMGVDGISVGLQAIVGGIIECTATYSSRGDMVINTAAKILSGEPFVRDTVLQTTMVYSDAAQAILMQYNERMHDIETMKIVQIRTDTMMEDLRFHRHIIVIVVSFTILLFVLIIAFLFYSQHRLQTEIKEEVVPQLENVQEAIQLSRRDEAFTERLKQIVDAHLTDPNLNVEYLASLLQLSRTQIFRRVKSVSGKGPLDYIRERRLIRANELLHTTDMTVQQVALELCFSSPGYFTKCYKEYFGHLPSSVK